MNVCKLAYSDDAAAAVEAYAPDYQGLLTVGLAYRNPRTHNKPMTAQQLAKYIRQHGRSYWWDVTDDGALHASAYSANDMF